MDIDIEDDSKPKKATKKKAAKKKAAKKAKKAPAKKAAKKTTKKALKAPVKKAAKKVKEPKEPKRARSPYKLTGSRSNVKLDTGLIDALEKFAKAHKIELEDAADRVVTSGLSRLAALARAAAKKAAEG